MPADHTAFYQRQISLTEWLESIDHRDSAAIRQEDNDKRERLAVLNREIGLPYDKPHQFSGEAVAGRNAEFRVFLQKHGSELCAIRLIPLQPNLSKLRVRGHSIAEAVKWFDEQTIDPKNYRVDFVPHSEQTLWATTFVVNDHGVFGEVTSGVHSDLTQGLYHGEGPITFSFNYNSWQLSRPDKAALAHVKDVVQRLQVANERTRVRLAKELSATFTHDYLQGYFETSCPSKSGLWFIDYNRILGMLYADFIEPAVNTSPDNVLVSGRVGCKGVVTGRVRIIDENDLVNATIRRDEILVCRMTTPDYITLMKHAVAIVTDLGGILSHAAIVARELGKPCITGTQQATQKLSTGMRVQVDADRGVVTAAS